MSCVVRLPRPTRRAIVVEPAPRGLWLFRVYFWGAFTGTRCEPGERYSVVDYARQYTELTGLPAYYRGNVHAKAVPMRRTGRTS